MSAAPSRPPTSIRRLQAHYFAVYAVFGCVTPYLPVYLRDIKHLAPAELGYIFATGQSAVLVMPILMTYLADRYRLVSPLLMVLFALNIVAMTSLLGAVGFWACLICVALNRLATQPQVALGDGLYFTLQNDPTQPRAPFSVVRVWGTIGFIAPSLIIFASYQLGGGLGWVPWVTAGWALFGVWNARALPARFAPLVPSAAAAPHPTPPVAPVPTLAALRVLRRPPLALFTLGVGLVIASNMAFYGFYPLYLTAQIGIDEKWIGLISSLGVAGEIGYMLALERLRTRFGFGGLIVIGGAASVFRLVCLGFLPTTFFAIVFQAFHGLTVIAFMIVPVMYLNAHAEEGFRNSIQGVYVMIVAGLFSIAGNIFAGQLAEIGLLVLYRGALVLCLAGLAFVAASFRLARTGRAAPAPSVRR